uniref:hypothetical protein n=1 Tax=Amycolatopsis sp. CA-096443 TaxID=3239919 RepID=UPI003F4932C8
MSHEAREMAEVAFNAAEKAHQRNQKEGRPDDPQLILAMAYAAHALALHDTAHHSARP